MSESPPGSKPCHGFFKATEFSRVAVMHVKLSLLSIQSVVHTYKFTLDRRLGTPGQGFGAKKMVKRICTADVRKALSDRLGRPPESLRSYLLRSFDEALQPKIREMFSVVSPSLQEILDNGLAVQIEEEKPLLELESPIFSVAEIIDKVLAHLRAH